LKKRTKKLLPRRPESDGGAWGRLRSQFAKVFWFFFSKKNYFTHFLLLHGKNRTAAFGRVKTL